jgi:splicing factor 3A subunit 3
MLVEEQRYIHEDLERLEQGIADRMRDEPKQVSAIFLSSMSCRILNSHCRFGIV